MNQFLELTNKESRFRERAERAGAKVVKILGPAELAKLVDETTAGSEGKVVVPPGLFKLAALQAGLGEKLTEASSTAVIARCAAGISAGEFGIAETGTVVYAVNDPLEREVAMLSPLHFALLRPDAILPGLEEAGKRIKALQLEEGRRYVSFVTGPSRTADIERVLTIGVQGPKELVIVLIESLEEV